ncbi:MAG TPA: hypothetical protein PK682_01595 [Niabella sp.]|nr:hypothetical protein [Niabella sp.]HQX19093.1 hypothetical protein [Niabella sp.]HRB06383.1 hypothetical protein [Niabella sp.]HRB34244.1 hypothetical protein [Niabella sp.]HRB41529.1 hypothetical protein [Niabella sp.]
MAQLYPNRLANNLTLEAGAEMQSDNFRWSIAGNKNGEEPNVLSEVIYNPVKSAGFHIHAHYRAFKKFSIAGGFSKIYAYKGSATDFDYDGDDRTDPSVSLYLKSDKGDQSHLHGQVFYHLLENASWNVKAGGGYRMSKELYYLLDDDDPSLKTTYLAKWKGPQLALATKWTSSFKLFVSADFSYQFMRYDAEANWNNITNFQHPVSFIQFANGRSWNLKGRLGYQFHDHFYVALDKLLERRKSDIGLDRLFMTDGSKPETRMNGAIKKSDGWRLSVGVNF